jgi:A/G-specific adenine glycosylase
MNNLGPNKDFARRLIAWQKRHGRHDLPWQKQRDPYRVWLSEIMLQQTQVATVIPYYRRFLARFPDLASLAAAPQEEVMALWSGLGYYARARNLQRAAQEVVARHGGRFPRRIEDIEPCPASAAPPPPPSPCSPSARARRSSTATSSACWRGSSASTASPARKRGEAPVGAGRIAAARARHRGLHPGPDGPRRDAVQPRQPRCGDCPLAAQCVALRDGRIAELPTPRAPRAVPQRAVRVLVLLNRGSVLLERRPPQGIWGGLLSLPELPEGALPRRYAGAQPLPVVRHAFTHFRLDIAPLAAKVSRRDTAPDGVWLSLKRLDAAPLPAPIRKILESL